MPPPYTPTAAAAVMQSAADSQPDPYGSFPPSRRPRASRACEMCRTRKTKCDMKTPCSHCAHYGLACVFRPREADMRGKKHRRHRATQQPSDGEPSSKEQKQTSADSPTHSLPAPAAANANNGASYDASDACHRDPDQTGHGSTVATSRLDGVNTITSGTEFYGGSSNLGFLARLFDKARKHLSTLSDARHPPSENFNGTGLAVETNSDLRHLSGDRLSLVDLMYSTDYTSPAGRGTASGRAPVATDNSDVCGHLEDTLPTPASGATGVSNSATGPSSSSRTRTVSDARAAERARPARSVEVERIFIDEYFHNKHFIHPMLTEDTFRDRCANGIWSRPEHDLPMAGRKSHFLALYFAVVALGAINSGVDHEPTLAAYGRRTLQNVARTPLGWANHYFDLAKKALGDFMEVSSLEICQALFAMTVFCQNALKPHACYMYSGMAVRTAISIGLASHSPRGQTLEMRRTWWCIYSHEMHYSSSVPEWLISDPQTHDTAIISVMVGLATILKTAAQELYSDNKDRDLSETSSIGTRLNADLDAWRMALPSFLDLGSDSLSDKHWAYKQKLVLKMRYYNARILINRPFLHVSTSHDRSTVPCQHRDTCLEAARQTIRLIRDALIHRLYLRTWWYCTTYTLYASMIILYLVLIDSHAGRGKELLTDVEASLEIFNAMKQVVVARRCAELTKEMLTVARRHLTDPQRQQPAVDLSETLLANAMSRTEGDRDERAATSEEAGSLASILNHQLPGWERTDALATLYDPTILEAFAYSSNEMDTFANMTVGLDGIPREGAVQNSLTWKDLEPFEFDNDVLGVAYR